MTHAEHEFLLYCDLAEINAALAPHLRVSFDGNSWMMHRRRDSQWVCSGFTPSLTEALPFAMVQNGVAVASEYRAMAIAHRLDTALDPIMARYDEMQAESGPDEDEDRHYVRIGDEERPS